MKTSKIFLNLASSFCVLLLIGAANPVSANSVRMFELSADAWARPRSGAVIPELTSIRSAVDYWSKGADAILVIRYPGEDSGEFWAAELRDWLISLGVPSDYIRLRPGSEEADEITLIVGNRSELEQ